MSGWEHVTPPNIHHAVGPRFVSDRPDRDLWECSLCWEPVRFVPEPRTDYKALATDALRALSDYHPLSSRPRNCDTCALLDRPEARALLEPGT